MKTKLLLLLTLTLFIFKTNAQCTGNVNIPNTDFKSALLNNHTIDLDNNNEISCTEASNYTGSINVSNLSIDDLTGIEAFINITSLTLNRNYLEDLDVSKNTALTSLSFSDNYLTSIDLSHNISLTEFSCSNSALTNLDLSNNTALTKLSCGVNALVNLNVANGNNTNVTSFYAAYNANLTCIEVDDTTYSATNWTNIDATASFSTNCVIVTPVIVNSITVQGQAGVSTITTQGGTLQMEADVLPANADDATYTWSVNNANASISATGLLSAITDGTVEVTATANDGSGVTGSKTITISNQSTNPGTGINDLSFENLNVFPNPTNGIINLNVSEKLSSIRIMDLTGKTMKVFKAEAKQLNISEFTTGIYFLEIANAERKSVVKIVKR